MVGEVNRAGARSQLDGLPDAMRVEWLKLRRSRLPLISLIAITIAAATAGLFTFIAQDPARARSLGLVGAKAQLATFAATWPAHLTFLAQITAVGGFLVFGVAFVWIFGREFADHTAKDLLALPTARRTIVIAKLTVATAWCLALSVELAVLGVLGGSLLQLPGWSIGALEIALLRLLVTALLTILLASPLALAASAGRGYLAGMWTLFALVFTAQILAALGYGAYYPWSVPAIYSGLAGPGSPAPGPVGYALVVLVGVLSCAGTVLWWQRADQST